MALVWNILLTDIRLLLFKFCVCSIVCFTLVNTGLWLRQYRQMPRAYDVQGAVGKGHAGAQKWQYLWNTL